MRRHHLRGSCHGRCCWGFVGPFLVRIRLLRGRRLLMCTAHGSQRRGVRPCGEKGDPCDPTVGVDARVVGQHLYVRVSVRVGVRVRVKVRLRLRLRVRVRVRVRVWVWVRVRVMAD